MPSAGAILYARAIAASLVALAVLALAPSAGAAQKSRPPDDSAIDQYLPSVPGAGGDQTVDGDKGNGGSSLPAGVVAELEEQGGDGVAVAGLAEATAPLEARKDGDGAKAEAGGSALGGVVSGATGGSEGGMGIVLPIILAAALAAALLAAVLRRRRGEGPIGTGPPTAG